MANDYYTVVALACTLLKELRTHFYVFSPATIAVYQSMDGAMPSTPQQARLRTEQRDAKVHFVLAFLNKREMACIFSFHCCTSHPLRVNAPAV